ncbi:MAG: fibrillarin-like rRNA/tRNA 2'-O-methyltransferase [Candidatus Thermoplasmatota archaeon]|nr:fibrillarin-like rRNA/tRNA 2'-O-methyltransferase [Candidatus Thermoplasmatota archaeon]MEC8609470.1 fibrillarin-like rRNA/tRNA 2'-O-methyltransferase [Candidatus Thermoplasmatota archaeon]
MAKNRRIRPLSDSVLLEGRNVWTVNANPGVSIRGESLRKFRGVEHRRWDPNRSKLSAGLLRTRNDPSNLLPQSGSTVLYLGAGHGTTISHLHDHLCGKANQYNGRLVAVDLAPRCLRDLTHLAEMRPGLVPVLGDARKFDAWGVLIPSRVDWLFQDVAQAGQVEIFLSAVRRFLSKNGVGLLSLKAASERHNEGGDQDIFAKAIAQLSSEVELVEHINLTGFEDQHALFVIRRK